MRPTVAMNNLGWLFRKRLRKQIKLLRMYGGSGVVGESQTDVQTFNCQTSQTLTQTYLLCMLAIAAYIKNLRLLIKQAPGVVYRNTCAGVQGILTLVLTVFIKPPWLVHPSLV
jgi:hypothetical protein